MKSKVIDPHILSKTDIHDTARIGVRSPQITQYVEKGWLLCREGFASRRNAIIHRGKLM
jgi:hypothetical protein